MSDDRTLSDIIIEKSMVGSLKHTRAERRAVAHHEAGHAVAGLITGQTFQYVTIDPVWDDQENCILGGHVQFDPVDGRTLNDAERRAFGIMALAGPVAQHWDQKHRHHQEDVFGPSADGDRANANAVAKSESELCEWLAATIELVNENCHHIRKLALALQQRGTLTQDEVWDLLTQRDPEVKQAA